MAREVADPGTSTKALTFLIADVRGYTRFTKERGDAAAAMLAQRFADLARDAVEARCGRVIELRGDEALAVFESPGQAVRAAVEFQATCAEESESDPAFPLPVGIGIDSGEAVPVEDGYRGAALNMAARLCSNAGAGQVLVTRTIVASADAVDGGIRFVDRGPASFKGFDQAVDVIEAVAGEAPHPPPAAVVPEGDRGIPPELDPLTPLVDREHEMRWVRGTWRQVRRGNGRVLVVSGPAQIGKTRLAGEIAAHIHADGGVIRYAGPGGTATAMALSAIRATRETSTPTLLVLDDVDVAGPAVAQAIRSSFEELSGRPVLLLALLRDAAAGPDLSGAIDRADARGDGHRVLAPLDLEGVRGIVRLYAGEDTADAPVESMARATGGVPGRVHEVVAEWARSEATRRLAAAAEFLAAGRDRHASDLQFANNVIGLKLGRLYSVEGRDVLSAETCPYKGLAAFEEVDSGYFFGRERLVGELAARTVEVGLLGVVGASGSGKSSVIAAGLLPSLRAGLLPGSEHWRQVSMRPGEHPMDELRTALSTEADDSLNAAIADLAIDGRLVLAVDQFEETFTICAAEEERAAFIDVLIEATRWPERVVVIVAIRGDYYARCAPYAGLAEGLAANHVLVGPLTREELRRAIELPPRQAGLRVESALSDALVAEVADEPGGLPLLSTALVELWQGREDGWIRMEAHKRTGGVRGAVSRLAESSYAELSEAEQEAARRVFLRLVATGGGEAATRRRVSLEEFDLDQDAAATGVLARLTQDRLLTMGEGTVEVAHEALLREWPRLHGWLEEDAQGRQLRHHLNQASRQWQVGGQEPSELYRGARLSATLDWSAGHASELNELERAFITASRQAGEREAERQRRTNRRLRGLLVGVAVFLVVALVAGALALIQRGSARRSATEASAAATAADAQRLGAQALVQKEVDVAMLLAREGVNLDDSIATESTLLAVLAKWNQALGVIRPGIGGIATMDISGNGRWIVTTSFELNANTAVTDARTGRTVRAFKADLSRAFVTSFGGTNRTLGSNTLVVQHGPSGIEGEDPLTGAVRWRKTLPPKSACYCNVALTVDGGTLAIQSYRAITLYHVPTMTRILRVRPPDGKVFRDVVFGPDGRQFLAGFAAGTGDIKRESYVRWNIAGSRIGVITTASRAKYYGAGPFYSPDLRWVAMANIDGTIDLYDTNNGERKYVLQASDFSVGLRFSPDSKTLVSSGHDKTVSVWDLTSGDLASGAPVETLSVGAWASGLAFSPDGKTLYTGGTDGDVLIWDLSGDRRLGRPLRGEGGGDCDAHPAFAISPNGRTLAVAEDNSCIYENPHDSLDGQVTLRTLSTMATRHVIDVPAVRVAFSPDGRTLATAGASGSVKLWDVATGKPSGPQLSGPPKDLAGLKDLPNGRDFSDEMVTVRFSPDGTLVAAGGLDGKVYLWNAATGAPRQPLVAPPDGIQDTAFVGGHPDNPLPRSLPDRVVRDVAFSPDGAELAESIGSSVVVWEVATGAKVATLSFDDGSGQVRTVAFSPDGKLLAVGEGDGHLRLYDTARWKEVGQPIVASAGAIWSVAFDPSGKTVMTAGDDSIVRLYDVDTLTEIGSGIRGFGGPVSGVFTPDGSHIVIGNFSSSAQAFEWDIRPKDWAAHACEVAGRNLTQAEWSQFLPDRPYQPVCPNVSR